MKKFPLILDLETKHTFRQYSDPKKLGVSIVAVYDYAKQQPAVFFEQELRQLFPLLESASYIIGFNIHSFDLPVLQAYYPGRVEDLPVFDIMEDIRQKIDRRLALNDILQATLNKRKSGHGLQAINYYQSGNWEKLKQYCLDDVMLTKAVFDYGVKTGEINYLSSTGKQTIKVNWKKYLEKNPNKQTFSLTLPF